MKKIFDLISKAYLILIFLFLYAPIFVVILFSFNNSLSRGAWNGFTLKWYKELFHDPEILHALYSTCLIALLSSLSSAVIGILGIIAIISLRFVTRNIILNLIKLPLINPDIITGVSLMILYISIMKFIKYFTFGYITLFLSHVTFSVPYIIFSILPQIKYLANNVYEAALDLGAKPLYTFFKIILPDIIPGIITGMFFAFSLSLDDFTISFFTSGSSSNNLSVFIYSMIRRGINPKINALYSLVFLFIIFMSYFINKRKLIDLKK